MDMTQLQTLPTSSRKTVGPARRFPRPVLVGLAVVMGAAVYLALLAATGWVVAHFVPDTLTVSMLGHAKTVTNLHAKLFANLAVALAVLPMALVIEMLCLGWQESSLRAMVFARTPSLHTDLAIFALGQAHVLDFVGKLMMLGVSMISGLWIRDWLKAHTGFAIDPSGLPLLVQVMIYFYVYTFFDYWTHRFNHSHWFWPLHRYHHSAEEFYVVTGDRQHPAAFTGVLMINLPMAVLGATPQVLIWVNLLVNVLGYLIHSRIDANWGWVGRWVVQSPNHHRLHHKLDMSYPTGHFSMAPLWDRLFGTWHGDADQTLIIGVDTPYRHGVFVAPDLARDYWDFWRTLAKPPPPKPVYAHPPSGPSRADRAASARR